MSAAMQMHYNEATLSTLSWSQPTGKYRKLDAGWADSAIFQQLLRIPHGLAVAMKLMFSRQNNMIGLFFGPCPGALAGALALTREDVIQAIAGIEATGFMLYDEATGATFFPGQSYGNVATRLTGRDKRRAGIIQVLNNQHIQRNPFCETFALIYQDAYDIHPIGAPDAAPRPVPVRPVARPRPAANDDDLPPNDWACSPPARPPVERLGERLDQFEDIRRAYEAARREIVPTIRRSANFGPRRRMKVLSAIQEHGVESLKLVLRHVVHRYNEATTEKQRQKIREELASIWVYTDTKLPALIDAATMWEAQTAGATTDEAIEAYKRYAPPRSSGSWRVAQTVRDGGAVWVVDNDHVAPMAGTPPEHIRHRMRLFKAGHWSMLTPEGRAKIPPKVLDRVKRAWPIPADAAAEVGG